MGFLSNEWKLGLQEGYVDLRLRGHFNQVVPLSKYKGHVCVIVNVASKCGLTATNYKELNELYDKYSESHGLRILAFPCNQFSGQEPGSSDDICSFAILLYLIDSALLRPGRFDKLLYVGIYADKESKLSVLKAITRKFSLENWDILERIAAELPDNVTGADLQAVCSNAWLNAAKRVIRKWESEARDGETRGKLAETVEVVEADFVEAVGGLVPSVSQEELRKYEQLHGELTSKKRVIRKKGKSGEGR